MNYRDLPFEDRLDLLINDAQFNAQDSLRFRSRRFLIEQFGRRGAKRLIEIASPMALTRARIEIRQRKSSEASDRGEGGKRNKHHFIEACNGNAVLKAMKQGLTKTAACEMVADSNLWKSGLRPSTIEHHYDQHMARVKRRGYFYTETGIGRWLEGADGLTLDDIPRRGRPRKPPAD